MLLARGMARLVVVDSVAAPFRCEFDGAALALRAQRLLALGAELRRLSCAFRSPVLCVNQVGLPPARRGPGQRVPSLTALHPPGDGGPGGAGLSGRAARVSDALRMEGFGGPGGGGGREALVPQVTRGGVSHLRMSPALGITWANQLLVRLLADRQRPEEAALAPPGRTLRVVFAPHLPPSSCSYTITSEGVRGTPGTTCG